MVKLLIQAIQAIQTGQVDVCIAMGALTDLSYLECQGLLALGAMGSDRFANEPELACRPFDKNRDGFIFWRILWCSRDRKGGLCRESQD